MRIVTGFFAYFPTSDDRGQTELAHAASMFAAGALSLVRRDPYVLAVSTPEGAVPTEPSDQWLDVFPGTAASTRLAAAAIHRGGSLADVHRRAEASAQCYNLLQPAENAFALDSDALGLKPVYTARTPGGAVLASRIADVLRAFPALAEPVDIAALYEMLGFWGPLAGRTLHQPIRRTLPGGCYRWTPAAGLSCERGRELAPASIRPAWLMDQLIEAIHAAAAQSLREKTQGLPRPLQLALSGGYDSRFIAALCGDEHIPVRAVTYGRRHHSELRSTRAVARTLGLDLKVLRQLVDGTLRYLPQFLDATEGTADPGAASILNLLRIPTTHGSALLHGFGGDVQAGMHVGDFSAADYASRESLAAAIMQRSYLPRRAGLLRLLQPPVDPDQIHEDVLAGLREDCLPYAAYQHWYLENRTRRYVATHFGVLGAHFDVVMPFYDRRLFDIWHSIPPVGLTDRAVFKRLLAHYYPKLARIGHPEESAPVAPNLHWQLARFYHKLPAHLLAACVGGQRANEFLLRLHRHDNFRTLSKLEAPQQRAWMIFQLTQLRPALRDGLGVELLPGYEAVLAGDNQALRTMFAVACYAQRRCEASG